MRQIVVTILAGVFQRGGTALAIERSANLSDEVTYITRNVLQNT